MQGQGWIVDTRTGIVERVHDFAHEIQSNPGKYRVNPEKIQGLSTFRQQDRHVFQRAAMEGGQMFVSRHHGTLMFEHASEDRKSVVEHMLQFLKDHKISDRTTVHVRDFNHREGSFFSPVYDLARPEVVESIIKGEEPETSLRSVVTKAATPRKQSGFVVEQS